MQFVFMFAPFGNVHRRHDEQLRALPHQLVRHAGVAQVVADANTDLSPRRFPEPLLARRQAIVEATVRRARPVVLTALAAILAMIPLSRSAFWGPMAITIMGGLFVATFLTLLYLPGLYALWFRKRLDEFGTGRGPVDAVP